MYKMLREAHTVSMPNTTQTAAAQSMLHSSATLRSVHLDLSPSVRRLKVVMKLKPLRVLTR